MQEIATEHINNTAIEDLIKVRREEYLKSPLRIVEDYNNENKNIDEYNGRQLLEMIQNANDESDTLKAKKVFIKLNEETLLIANNGNAFSLGGVESLMYSDLSPKTMEENKVGKKGLGFRSILNWSKEIYIASYDLHLKFSQLHAKNFLKRLLEEKPEIKDILKRKTKKKIPISVLRCPYLEEDSSKKKEKTYDTVIELTLKEGVHEFIVKQIEVDIVPEILIFLNKLEEIEVQTPDVHFSFSKYSNTADNNITILKNDFINPENNQEWAWNILEEKGQIEGVEETKNYELKIAYNPNEEVSFRKLFSFFRTEVDFPYPVIAHGSFELKTDRNHLARDENNFNVQLIEKLAKLLVDCALKLTENDISNYEALKLLIPTEYQNSSLYDEPWNFDELIKEYISKTAIFPTITNNYITLEEDPKFYEVEIDHLIPEAYFSDFRTLLKSTSDDSIIDYLFKNYIGLNYPEEEFTKSINRIIDDDGFTLEQKVKWISLLSKHTKSFYYEEEPILPNLLINTEGEIIITGKDEVILPPKGTVYDLPGKLELQFINKDFVENLKENISGDVRDLSIRLKVFQVDEYSMIVVARKVISGTHKLLKQSDKDHLAIMAGMHNSLYHIFDNMKEDFDKTSFFQNLPSPLLFTRKGKLKPANKLYFGKDYEVGYLCENLLKSITIKDVFVGSIKSNGLDTLRNEEHTIRIEKYLGWIGVADMPRRKILERRSIPNFENYVNHIFNNLSFPYSIPNDNKTFETQREIESSYGHIVDVLWYDFFDEIIDSATIESILAWLIKDREVYNCIVSDIEHDDSSFFLLFDSVRNHRYIDDNDIKSYILFCLKNLNFIPVINGEKAKPTECVANSSNLSPLVHTPQINYDADVFSIYNIKEDQISLLLNRLGVKESFKELPIQVMYDLLSKHHKYFDKNKSSATTLYSAIVDATSNLSKDFNWDFKERTEYLENGFILSVVDGQNEYVSVKEATYVLNPNHSQDLLAKLKVSKIRQRVGNTRIRELFGIQPMDYIEFNVKNPLFNAELNDNFQLEFNQLKPLLFIYRQQKSLTEIQKKRELGSLKQLKIKICYSSEVEFSVNNKTQKLHLKNNEYVYEKETQTYFIQVNDKTISYNNLKQDYRFTETVSDIICGVIAVTENRKDFMLIIGQPQSKWREIMTREFSDFSDLESQVMTNFDGVLTAKQLFWRSILKATKIQFEDIVLNDEKGIFKYLENQLSWDEFFDIYRSLNYYQLSINDNYELISELFIGLGIDIKNFNKYSKSHLNFGDYYSNSLISIHRTVSKNYKSILYSKGYSEGFSNKIDDFESYDLNGIKLPNSLFLDLNGLYKKARQDYIQLDIFEIKNSADIDVEKIYQTNLKAFKKTLQEENIFDKELFLTMQYNNDFKDKIYFSKLSEILMDYKSQYLKGDASRRTVTLSPEGEEIDVADDEKLIAEIENSIKDLDLKIEFYSPEKAETKTKGNKNKNPGQSKNNLNKSSIANSDIGFIGEKYAFELLKKMYSEVIWKSEYAIRAGFSGGKDGFGYDFECIMNNETRFIEVKSTTSSMNIFHISKKEVKIGHLKKDNYDVLLIKNLLTENIEFKYLKNIFQYKNQDSFFDNSNFLVETDGFKIKFK